MTKINNLIFAIFDQLYHICILLFILVFAVVRGFNDLYRHYENYEYGLRTILVNTIQIIAKSCFISYGVNPNVRF